MILHEFLLNFIPSKEIKTRLKNNQIKVNNEVIDTTKLELNTLDYCIDYPNFMIGYFSEIPHAKKSCFLLILEICLENLQVILNV